ncbi:MAG: MmcQ/YjbR family DNA-binding protein [Pyrinomonadaceae bacterium]
MRNKSLAQILRSSPFVGLDFDPSRADDPPTENVFNEEMNITYETVRQIAIALPSVEDGLSYGAPALKVRKKLFVRLREDLNAIVLKTTFEEREELMAADADVYFITDHYLNWPYVLVNLTNVSEEALGDMIHRSYNLAIAEGKKPKVAK